MRLGAFFAKGQLTDLFFAKIRDKLIGVVMAINLNENYISKIYMWRRSFCELKE
jgi:hypothetical protein